MEVDQKSWDIDKFYFFLGLADPWLLLRPVDVEVEFAAVDDFDPPLLLPLDVVVVAFDATTAANDELLVLLWVAEPPAELEVTVEEGTCCNGLTGSYFPLVLVDLIDDSRSSEFDDFDMSMSGKLNSVSSFGYGTASVSSFFLLLLMYILDC